jgi:acyl-CoA synthetase (AMP-forming)/AMP-acid ligase II
MSTNLDARPSANLIARTPSAYGYPLLVKHLLHTALATEPDQQIVYRNLKRYDYRTLRQRIGRLASALALQGVEPGDTVAVMDWDSHRYLESYFAVPMMGAVLQTVNIRLAPEQILYTLNHARPTVLLVHADFLPVIEEIKDRIESVKTYVLLTDGGPRPTTSLAIAAEYEELLGSSSAEYEFGDFDENTRATTFYTTGTTGLPKGVYFSHRQLVLHTLAGLAALGTAATGQRFHRADVYMPITPMFHVHAWGIPYIATVMGVKQVYPGRYAPDVLLGLIQTEKVTFSHCVPTILHMLLNSPASQAVDLRGFKMIIGGSALPRGLARTALARGIDVFTGYGMSETCPILTIAQLTPAILERDAEGQLEIRTRAGRPLPLVDLRIVDEEMRDMPRDGKAAGEVVVRAPWLTQGYLDDRQSSEQLWRGGYLHTNDIANIDPDGYVGITDRIKDVIKSGGEWISSLEIEDILSQHPGVSEAAVIGAPDERWGERPLALIVPKPGYADMLTEDDIKAHVQGYADKGMVSRWAVPSGVRSLPALDKTSVGKLDKKLMRQKYAQ